MNPSPRSVLVSVACTTVISVCVLIPATDVPWKVSVLVPVLIAVTVVIPLAEKLGCKRVSLTSIPVTWSTTTPVAVSYTHLTLPTT